MYYYSRYTRHLINSTYHIMRMMGVIVAYNQRKYYLLFTNKNRIQIQHLTLVKKMMTKYH
jgi:hypothetical protein